MIFDASNLWLGVLAQQQDQLRASEHLPENWGLFLGVILVISIIVIVVVRLGRGKDRT
ncbi:MAG: hypothetical protein ACK55O_01395 [Phycisphaerales bacterium]|jgi:hypothetical protein|nr:hypothetical protein [Phycisphaeraceae bacterium]